MSLRISFELSDNDIKHFRGAMRKARQAVREMDDAAFINAARPLLAEVERQRVPVFVRQRLDQLQALVDMLEDKEWHMAQRERERVLSVLAYFTDPDDLIPDDIPGLGFLDDAIMIELACKELRHEIEAYTDFCAFRSKYDSGFRLRRNPEKRARKLAERQQQLRERAERRHVKDEEQGQDKVF